MATGLFIEIREVEGGYIVDDQHYNPQHRSSRPMVTFTCATLQEVAERVCRQGGDVPLANKVAAID